MTGSEQTTVIVLGEVDDGVLFFLIPSVERRYIQAYARLQRGW